MRWQRGDPMSAYLREGIHLVKLPNGEKCCLLGIVLSVLTQKEEE